VYVKAYEAKTKNEEDLYDEVLDQLSIVSFKKSTELEGTYDFELIFIPTGDSLQIQGYLTDAETEEEVNQEILHYMEINGHYKHRSTWKKSEDEL